MHRMKTIENVSLELIEDFHAYSLFQLVNTNRVYLRKWLPWVDYMITAEQFESFVKVSRHRYDSKSEVPFVITWNKKVVGRMGLYNLDHANKIASVGYWLGEEFTGKGIATEACRQVLKYAFEILELNRVEIRCGENNVRSRLIPERLGFSFEGILREAEMHADKFINLRIYSLLAGEWKVQS